MVSVLCGNWNEGVDKRWIAVHFRFWLTYDDGGTRHHRGYMLLLFLSPYFRA